MFDKSFDNLQADVSSRSREYYIDDSAATANASYTLKPYQQFVRVTGDDTYTTTIYLPSCRECAGMIFSIYQLYGGGQTTSIYPSLGEGVVDHFETEPLVLTETGDRVILFSDGIEWCVLGVSGLTITSYDG